MKFENSKTKENLKKALQGESLAHLKYQFYRSKISQISKELEQELDEIVHNEKEHGKIWFKKLNNDKIPDDVTNLKDAIKGEWYEANKMYPEFAKTAKEEGFTEIAYLFEEIGKIEEEHWAKFETILMKIEDESLFTSKTKKEWKCLNCGHILISNEAPEECPICKHPIKYFTNVTYEF